MIETKYRIDREVTGVPPPQEMPKKKATCDLCCDHLEKGQDILQCEGSCGCTVHRYCAGVTKWQFEELNKGYSLFVCQWCSLNTANSVIQQLQAEVAALKLELQETKGLLAAAKTSAPTAPPRSYASAVSSQPPNLTRQRNRR